MAAGAGTRPDMSTAIYLLDTRHCLPDGPTVELGLDQADLAAQSYASRIECRL